MSAFVYFGWISDKSETYQVLNLIQNAVFYYLPFLIALDAAEQFKINKFFALVLAGIILSPTIMSAVDAGTKYLHVFGIPILVTDCSSTVIPIILAVELLYFVENRLTKIVPGALRMLIVPGVSFLVCGIISLVAFAPLGTWIGNVLNVFIKWALDSNGAIGVLF